MFLFNLSLPELLGLVGLGSAVVVALYMLDRSRRTIEVSTLRFWKGTERQVEATRRKRVQQWPSLLMQLAAIALLLLAIAQLRLGSRDTTSLDHVLLVDTSAWMAAQPAGEGVLMEQARTLALNYLASLAPTDRVMVVYADGLATPVTAFESSRVKARQAVMGARATASSLHLADALLFAQQAQSNARRPGEIILAGGSRPMAETLPTRYPKNFRILETKGEAENVGIRRIGLRPADDAPNVWRVLVSVANYSDRPRTANLGLSFGGTPATSRNLTVPARAATDVAFDYTTGASGILEARLSPDGRDDLKTDNTASVELPGLKTVAITVCSDQPRLLQPVFDSLPSVAPTFRTLADCKTGALKGLAVYEGMAPVGGALNSIVIGAPAGESKVPVLTTARTTKFTGWRPDHPITLGLRSENETIDNTLIFAPAANDLTIAQSSARPVAVVHTEAASRQLYLGFHPLRSSFRYEVTAPLFFANALRWLAPDAFNRHEIVASGVGATLARVDADAPVKVFDEKGQALPFSRQGSDVRFFAPLMGRVRVVEGAPGATTAALVANEQVFSMALPDVPEKTWEKPQGVLRGIPRPRGALSGGSDIWYWLALAGGALLLADWMLFAPGVRRMAPSVPSVFRRAA